MANTLTTPKYHYMIDREMMWMINKLGNRLGQARLANRRLQGQLVTEVRDARTELYREIVQVSLTVIDGVMRCPYCPATLPVDTFKHHPNCLIHRANLALAERTSTPHGRSSKKSR